MMPHASLASRRMPGGRLVLLVCMVWVSAAGPSSLQAQTGGAAWTLPDRVVDIRRPRVAAAPDGGFALVYEGFVRHEPFDEWQIVVERFDAAGRTRGAALYFEPEDACAYGDLWNEDYQTHAEPLYGPDGTLFVAMTHAGLRDLFNGFVQGAETALGVVSPEGQIVDLAPDYERCLQYKPRFSGLSTEYQPRLALAADDVVLAQEGRFELQGQNEPEVANSALHVILGGVDAARTLPTEAPIAQAIVHDDPLSRVATHEDPDVAAAGSRLVTVWQECPYEFVVENFDVVTRRHSCSIQARSAVVTDGVLQPGEAVPVSAAPEGTFSLSPSVAMNAAGGSVVAWADTRTGSQGDVFVQRFGAQGEARGGNVQASTGEGQLYTRPEIAMRPDGAFAVVWTDSTETGLRAMARRYDAAGQPQGAPFRLGTTPQSAQPHVAATADDYLFTWLGRTDAAADVTLHAQQSSSRVDAASGPPRVALSLSVFPNPSTAAVTVTYTLPHGGPAAVTIHDLLGRIVAQAKQQVQPRGRHAWRLGVEALPAGVYLVRLETPRASVTQRLVVVR